MQYRYLNCRAICYWIWIPLLQYEPAMTPGNEHLLHHMEVFHCISLTDDPNEAFPLWSGPCGSEEAPEKLKQCKKVLAAWAIGNPNSTVELIQIPFVNPFFLGAGPFTYPAEAGLEIGGPDFGGLYVMLEVHYNNQQLESGSLKC